MEFVVSVCLVFPSGSDGKESACNAADLGSIPGSGRSPGEGNDYPFLYSCLENPMDIPMMSVRISKYKDTSQTGLEPTLSS